MSLTDGTDPSDAQVPIIPRVLLVIVGILFLVTALVLIVIQRPISTVTEVNRVAVSSTPTPTPPVSSPPATPSSTKVTETKGTLSDAGFAGIAGLGAVFILAAAFYERLLSLKFLGMEVGLSAYAKKLKPEARRQFLNVAADDPAIKRLPPEVRLALVDEAADKMSLRAARIAMLGKESPADLMLAAERLDVPADEIRELTTRGRPTRNAWRNLAETALAEAKAATGETGSGNG